MGIFDFLAKKTPAPKRPRGELMSEVAFDHLANGRFQLPEVDEVLAKAGKNRQELRKVLADDEINAAVETRLTALQSVPWRLDPWQDDPVATELWDMLAPHMEAIITGAFMGRLYGYSVMEAVYKREGGRIVLDNISEKPFEWFEPRRDGTLRYYPAGGSSPQVVDTQFKFFLTRYQPTYQNPKGQALLSTLYWPWIMRSQGWRFWAKFLERFGQPFALGKTKGDVNEMATALATLVQGGIAAVGDDDEVNIVSPGTDGGSFEKFDTAVAKRVQKVVLGQTLTSDVQGGGSFAAAKVQDLVRADRKTADIRLVTQTVQCVINALCALNFPAATPPGFILEDGEGLGLERATRDGDLVSKGVLKFTEQYVLNNYDVEEGDFVIPEAVAAVEPETDPEAEPEPEPEEDPEEFAASKFTADQAAVEALAASAVRKAPSPVPPELIRDAITAATSPDDLKDRLGKLFAAHDPAEFAEFAELTERALFAADVMGYVHAEEGVE